MLALDPRRFESTASSPSLRATDHDYLRTFGIMPGSPKVAGADQDSANVKVVVRVRQFVPRGECIVIGINTISDAVVEIERNAPCIIRMDPSTQMTTLLAPSELSNKTRREDKSFTFDKSFWSHNSEDQHYATQEDIYSSFGEEFLDHNFDGFHTCIFAYGQTGSGKSYTMMGTPEQPGLIHRTCEALFARISDEPEPNTTYSVHVSYFEVYNEHVRDLLVPKTNTPYYLKIRESQTDGVYVQGLTDAAVKSFEDVQRLMNMGDLVWCPMHLRSLTLTIL
jgi:hypothetical protein